ncbi:MAG: ABC transporter substrate-binding protein [Rhodospirillaceae bacterium]|nr:ABC transporter substrate-binding protein [Rhodospirillaceae bacterium]MBT4487467.1 ABC transporter substrate-binding protein [Rhodospirillaceae bacterium]MBT6430391.1 ABC transporter substrate-binding protein [Rhodospirillaceae bacterium]
MAQAGQDKFATLAMSLTPLSAPVIIAAEKGYFAKHGVTMTINGFVGGHRSMKAMLGGQAHMATSSEAVVMFQSFKRNDFTVVCTFVTSDNDVKIITRKDTGIREVRDLTGRRVGTVTGASAQFFLDETLLLAGIDGRQVGVVHVNPEDSSSMLAKGAIDAMVVWEPLIYRIKQKLAGNGVIVPHDRVYTETFNLAVTKSFADKHEDVLESIVRALIEATKFIKVNQDEAQRIVARRINNDIELVKSVWTDFDFDISLHQWLLTTLETEARWAIDRDLVTATTIPNYLEYLHLRTLLRIDPGRVTVFH